MASIAAKQPDEAVTAGQGDAFLIGLAALAQAVDETGAVARKAGLLTRLASTLADINRSERTRLATLATLFENVARKD